MVDGQGLDFDLLGLYQDVFLMRDRQTRSVWAHLDGFASQGPLAGERLGFIPLPVMRWSDWKELHPGTVALDPNTGFSQWYDASQLSRYGSGSASYGDSRLAGDALVVGVESAGKYGGFEVNAVAAAGGLLNTEVGGHPVLVIYDAEAGTGIAFSRVFGGQVLTFSGTPNRFTDNITGQTWNRQGKVISTPLDRGELTFVPSFLSQWYGWSAYHPNTALYTG